LFELSGGVLTGTDSLQLNAPSVMSGGTLKGAGVLQGSWPGGPYVPGRLQSALDLGNGSRFAEVDDPADRHLDVGNAWTIEAWVNFDNVPTDGMQTIASKDEGPNITHKWILSYSADWQGVQQATTLIFSSPTIGVGWLSSNHWVPLPHVWYHIAVVKTNGDYVFYRNGVADGVAHTDVAMPTVIQAPLQIGIAEGSFALDGWVDDVRLWNVARSPNEVALNRGVELSGAEAGLVGYWRMNDFRGTVVSDSSRFASNGRLVGDIASPGVFRFVGGRIEIARVDLGIPLLQQGGVLAPGGPSTGTSVIRGYTQSADARLELNLRDSAGGTGFDTVVVNGPVSLAGTLAPLFAFAPDDGQVFTVIRNDAFDEISGTFADLPEGATMTVAGTEMRVSYVGGNGNDVTLTVLPAPPLVTATQVHVASSAWKPAFRQYLFDHGLGAEGLGYAVADGSAQLDGLPWYNLNEISVTFGADVAVDAGDLAVRGVAVANYALDAAAFAYDSTKRTATWRLAAGQTFANDRILLDLDGDSPNGVHTGDGVYLDGDWKNPTAAAAGGQNYPSGNGSAGGDFRFGINSLPGDIDRSGAVLANDFSSVKKKFFKDTDDPVAGTDADYSPFHDVNGSGSILADDFSEVKKRFFTRLPEGGPAGTSVTFAVTPLRRQTIGWDLELLTRPRH
jgi:hypothetical protein